LIAALRFFLLGQIFVRLIFDLSALILVAQGLEKIQQSLFSFRPANEF
jgi:hypothetical protein